MAKTEVRKLVVKSALRVVDLEKIQVDKSYQRDVKNKHKKIVADFNPDALGIPVIAEREDGTLWMVDSLQRMAALKKLEHKQVRAEVFNSHGPEHEAAVFKLINLNRTKLLPGEEFRALLTAQDEQAWAIKEAVEHCGFRLILKVDGSGKNKEAEKAAMDITGITTLRRIAEEGKQGVDAIRFALNTIKECWPGDRIGPNYCIIAGMGQFWERQEGLVDLDRLLPRLKTTTPFKVLYAARQDTISGGSAHAVANIIERIYRKRLKK